jgi:hypothetical protein
MMRRALILILLPVALASAQTTSYKSADGLWDIQAPAGWQVIVEPEGDVQFKDHAVTVNVAVYPRIADRMDPATFVKTNDDELKGQCPTFQSRQSKPSTLAGFPAVDSVNTCSDPKSPAVAETIAAASPDHTLLALTIISPLSRYDDVLPAILTMRATLHLKGTPPPVLPSAESFAKDRASAGCLVGLYTATECTRRLATAVGGNVGPPITGNVYTDPMRRFRCAIPTGWTATPEGDNGQLGVQLRSGKEFINLMTIKSSTSSAHDALVAYEQDQMVRTHSTRKPPYGGAGILQIFGAGLEYDFDDFTATDGQGNPVSGTYGSIAPFGGGNAVLIVQASYDPNDKTANVLAVAQSVRLTPDAK